jgi:hypothetical protein
MKCLMCSIEDEPTSVLKYSIPSLFILIYRRRLKPSEVLEGLCEHHMKELAHETFRAKTVRADRGADVIPFRAKKS